MYTGYIVKAGETCKDERVAKAIKNFKYENETVICVGEDGYITEINTLNQEGVENLNATLRACGDLEQQASRLKQLVDSFRI